MPYSTTMPINNGITQEEFNLFHDIDRRLFSLLIFNLGRDPAHATRVMALWLWLERVTLKSKIIYAILSLTYPIIDTLFDESLLCLHVAAFGPPVKGDIPVLKALLRGNNIDISLPYFHENKVVALHGVGAIVEDVCVRAFDDIVARFKAESSFPRAGHVAGDHDSRAIRHGFDSDPYFGNESNGYDFSYDIDPKDVACEFLLEDTDDVVYPNMNGLSINDGKYKEEDTRGREAKAEGKGGSNNKTLFLTFSKGYPISKVEVREFFTRFFGDIIEGLHMQDVGINEQPLYARLVVREVCMIDMVLQGQRKIKFSINGKHACARKYVRRRSSSPASPPATD